jgi:hypothetical protein
LSILLVCTASVLVVVSHSDSIPLARAGLQPAVTVVESAPARKAHGSLSMPEGSPWCLGRPTYWLVGHDNTPETPWCQQPDGAWVQPGIAALDKTDPLNAVDGPRHIDRHDCARIDANADGLPDIVCVVGANKGTGNGFHELYITQSDGRLERILEGHGLNKYASLRTRFVVALDAADGGKLIFIANLGIPRFDGRTNANRLFRLRSPSDEDGARPFFEEVDPDGPLVRESLVSFVLASDLNDDGVDDLLVGGERGDSHAFIQQPDLGWHAIRLDQVEGLDARWRNARAADVSGDGIADLLVVGPAKYRGASSYLRIYRGDPELPALFDFREPLFDQSLPFPAPDLALVDANADGLLDLYVVQRDETRDSYCGPPLNRKPWPGKDSQPPEDFVPPLDNAADLLFIAESGGAFKAWRMAHAEPGCGGLVEPWGERGLILAQGFLARPGHNLLLTW